MDKIASIFETDIKVRYNYQDYRIVYVRYYEFPNHIIYLTNGLCNL